MLELEGTVKRWDEVRAEIERLEAFIKRYGCEPLPPHRVHAAKGMVRVSVRFRCFDPFKELLVKMAVNGV